jgi:hypothetical protein
MVESNYIVVVGLAGQSWIVPAGKWMRFRSGFNVDCWLSNIGPQCSIHP